MKTELKTQELPTLESLVNDIEVAQKSDKFNFLCNNLPPKNWVVKHPFIANYYYLPIDKVEYLLQRIFREYKIEVMEYKMILNAVSCHVRVHFKHPVTDVWGFHDGVGAQEIQTTKESGSLKMDMTNINRGAIMMALPIAKTIAIKDACDHFGRLFGRDLNRKDLVENALNTNIQNIDLSKIKQQNESN